MNPEAQPIMPIMSESDVEAVAPSETTGTAGTAVTETAPTDPESIDADNFERAKDMEKFFFEISSQGSESERNIKSEHMRLFARGLLERINPKSGHPYTHEELNHSFWLYHIIIYDTLGTSKREDFPKDLEFDLPDGAIEHFIKSLDGVAKEKMREREERLAAIRKKIQNQ